MANTLLLDNPTVAFVSDVHDMVWLCQQGHRAGWRERRVRRFLTELNGRS
mgnify:CR=1 FL=1